MRLSLEDSAQILKHLKLFESFTTDLDIQLLLSSTNDYCFCLRCTDSHTHFTTGNVKRVTRICRLVGESAKRSVFKVN